MSSDNNQDIDKEISEVDENYPLPGDLLKKLREDAGIELTQLAESLHMTPTYLRELEANNYHKLPGKLFVKGYYKNYASYMNTDVDYILECYEKSSGNIAAKEKSEAKVMRAQKNHDQNIKTMIIAAIIIIAIIGVSWWKK